MVVEEEEDDDVDEGVDEDGEDHGGNRPVFLPYFCFYFILVWLYNIVLMFHVLIIWSWKSYKLMLQVFACFI